MIVQKIKNLVGQARGKNSRWIQTHVNFFYRLMAVVSILGLLFFVFSRAILGDDSPIQDGGVGAKTAQQLGGGTVTIVQRQVNPKSGYGELLFSVNQPTDNADVKFDAVVVDVNLRKKIPSQIERITDQYYVLHIEGIRSNWRQIGISYGLVTKSSPLVNYDYEQNVNSDQPSTLKDSSSVDQHDYTMDYRRVKPDDTAEKSSHETYVKKYVALEISDTKKAIQSVKKGQSDARQIIQKYASYVDDLSAQEGTATPYDLLKIKDSIKATEQKIDGLKKTIDSGDKAIKSYQQILKKLYEQQRKER